MRHALILLALSAAVVVAAPPGVPTAPKPEDVGVSAARLQRIHDTVARHIEAKDVSGAVTLVARRGRIVHYEAQGLADIDSKKPMAKDTIFRLASMSKPITSVAVMMMLEEGKVHLNDRVSTFIPEFKTMKVAVAKGTTDKPVQMPAFGRGGPPAAPPPEFDLVPAAREITVKDLLTHTSGLMSGGVSGAEQAKLAPRSPNDTLANYIPKLAQTPLDFQPGTLWRYSGLYGFDVLARIVEIASGMPYDQFLQQRLFTPLGMKDTGFAPTPERMARVATVYQRTPEGVLRPAPNANQLISGTYFSGSGGLMSTAEDYLQFAQMLVNGGSLNGKSYLSPKTVELMTANHTGDMVNGQFGRPARGMGFALGVQVWLDPVAADRRVSPGAYGWEGAYGTLQVMDPMEKMVEIIMMQGANGPLQRDFENAVRQSLIE
jgi:CubicO group peptidase (beta-lactamase class C family)